MDEARDPDEHIAVPGWVGCPHCEEPVNVRALLEERTADLAETFLGMLEEQGIRDKTLRTRLEQVKETAREMVTANMADHPFRTLVPGT